jgi:hypothetical protein
MNILLKYFCRMQNNNMAYRGENCLILKFDCNNWPNISSRFEKSVKEINQKHICTHMCTNFFLNSRITKNVCYANFLGCFLQIPRVQKMPLRNIFVKDITQQ